MRGLVPHPNDGSELPQLVDIIVSEGTTGNVGHVAIVKEVQSDLDYILVTQQNYCENVGDLNFKLFRGGNYISSFGVDKRYPTAGWNSGSYPIKGWLRLPSVSGKVMLNSTGLPNVTVTLTGTGSKLTSTDENGNYSFAGVANGSYTISAYMAGYAFTSQSITVNNVDLANLTVNKGILTVQDIIATASSLYDGLVAYYPLDGDANDYSGNRYNGTAFNGITYVSGIKGQAAYFDGIDQFITATQGTQQYDSITISFWANIEPQPSRIWIMWFGNPHVSGFHMLLSNSTYGAFPSLTQFGWFDATQNQFDDSNLFNKWVHVATIVDNNNKTIKSYINGVLVDSDVTNDVSIQSDPFIIGMPNSSWGGESYYKGALDEVRLYNRALSASEILALYNMTPISTGTGPLVPGGWGEVSP